MSKTIMITGASGRVGTALRPYLRSRYRLRLFDRVAPESKAESNEDVVVGDLLDGTALEDALEGVSAVIHLACVHGHQIGFEETLDANYRAHLKLLDACASLGIDRFVYASSHHVFGMYPRTGFSHGLKELAPDAFYGLSKAFGEAACAMYGRRHSIATLVVRIGNADPTVTDERCLRIWVSARDLAQLIGIGLERESLDYEVVYGVSECPQPLFDNHRAFELGYQPIDRAEDNLDPGYIPYESMPAQLGRDWVGGAYAAVTLPAVAGES